MHARAVRHGVGEPQNISATSRAGSPLFASGQSDKYVEVLPTHNDFNQYAEETGQVKAAIKGLPGEESIGRLMDELAVYKYQDAFMIKIVAPDLHKLAAADKTQEAAEKALSILEPAIDLAIYRRDSKYISSLKTDPLQARMGQFDLYALEEAGAFGSKSLLPLLEELTYNPTAGLQGDHAKDPQVVMARKAQAFVAIKHMANRGVPEAQERMKRLQPWLDGWLIQLIQTPLAAQSFELTGRLGGDAVVPALAERLQHDEDYQKIHAIRALDAMSRRGVSAATDLMNQEQDLVDEGLSAHYQQNIHLKVPKKADPLPNQFRVTNMRGWLELTSRVGGPGVTQPLADAIERYATSPALYKDLQATVQHLVLRQVDMGIDLHDLLEDQTHRKLPPVTPSEATATNPDLLPFQTKKRKHWPLPHPNLQRAVRPKQAAGQKS